MRKSPKQKVAEQNSSGPVSGAGPASGAVKESVPPWLSAVAPTGQPSAALPAAELTGRASPAPAAPVPKVTSGFAPSDASNPAPASLHPETLTQRKDFARRKYRQLDRRRSGVYLDQSGTDRLFLLAGSVLGAKHDQPGLMREDDVTFIIDPVGPGTVVAAVADGVSTAKLSHLTSSLAVQSAVDFLSDQLADPDAATALSDWESSTASKLVAGIAADIRQQLMEPFLAANLAEACTSRLVEEAYEQRKGKPAATLAVLAVDQKPHGFDVAWLTVGDCDVVIVDFNAGTVEWLTPRAYQNGPHTKAVPSQRWATDVSKHRIGDGQVVLAMTDGMAKILDDKRYELFTFKALAAADARQCFG